MRTRRDLNEKLTARQRVEKAINGQEPDRVPIFDFIQHVPLVEYVTGERMTPENAVDLLCRTARLYLDTVQAIAPPMPERLRKDPQGFVYKDEWWTTWLVERPFSDVNGLLEHVRQHIDMLQEYTPGSIWSYAGNVHIWGESDKTPREQFLELQDKLGDVVLWPTESPVGIDTAYNRAGWELFSYAYADDPELISGWLDALCSFEVQRIHDVADSSLSPLALVYGDLASNHGLLFSPNFLRREFFPRLRRVVEAWHAHGVKVIYHSEGNLMSVMDDFVAAGIDGINPVEPMGGMQIAVMKAKYPQLILTGGIDNTTLLTSGTVDEVREAVRRAIADGATGGRLLLGSAGQVHPACKVENALAMWEATWEFSTIEGANSLHA